MDMLTTIHQIAGPSRDAEYLARVISPSGIEVGGFPTSCTPEPTIVWTLFLTGTAIHSSLSLTMWCNSDTSPGRSRLRTIAQSNTSIELGSEYYFKNPPDAVAGQIERQTCSGKLA